MSAGTSRAEVCVVGGGVAGTTLAIALARLGIQCALRERSAEHRFQGGALVLWSNATRLLCDLGLYERVSTAGVELHRIEFRTAAGDVLWELDTRALSSAAGAPSLVVLRSELLALLDAEASRATHVQNGLLMGFQETDQAVELQFASGEQLLSKILVGADGLRSSVRSLLFPQRSGPRDLGQNIWVGSTRHRHALLAEGVGVASVGRGRRFWAAQARLGIVAWYAVFPQQEQPRDLWELSRLYADWHAPIVDLMLGAEDRDVVRTRVHDLAPCRQWGKSRVTLVGDAIHAVAPDLSQGACQAIESALALARSLAGRGLVPEALRHYESQRQARTARIAMLSQLSALIGIPSSRAYCAVRDQTLRWLLPWCASGELDWVLRSERF